MITIVQKILCLLRLRHTYRPATDREMMEWVAEEHRRHRLGKYQQARLEVCTYCSRLSMPNETLIR